jgi:myo-inositol-1(or 4)-monophosphatase
MVLEQRDLSRILETAIVAARLAGQRAMEEINYIKASVKNATELVTQADARCQQIIIDRIKENYPDHGFVAEEGDEGKIFKQPPRGAELLWWVIDPIDGTNNFAHRMLFFAIERQADSRRRRKN